MNKLLIFSICTILLFSIGCNRAETTQPEGLLNYSQGLYANVIVAEVKGNYATVQSYDYAKEANIGEPFKVKFTENTRYYLASGLSNQTVLEGNKLSEIKAGSRITIFAEQKGGDITAIRVVFFK